MIARARRTIASVVELRGKGLHEGRETCVRLLPAAAREGIRFVRTDLPGAPVVPARIAFREERPRRTALVAGQVEVHTVEHLLAAAGALSVTDLTVELDHVEVPGLDGSGLAYARALEEAGLAPLEGEVDVLSLDREIFLEAEGASIRCRPCPGRLLLTYELRYGEAIKDAEVEVEATGPVLLRDVLPARTFCLEREARALRAAGLGKGASTQNTLVITPDGRPLDNELRLPDECARHKLLDLFGDLMLAGLTIEAHIVAHRSGHALNAELARVLRALADEPPRAGD